MRYMHEIDRIIERIEAEEPAISYESSDGKTVVPTRAIDIIKSRGITRSELFTLFFGVLFDEKEYAKELKKHHPLKNMDKKPDRN